MGQSTVPILAALALLIGCAYGGPACENLQFNSEWGEGYDAILNFALDHSTSGWVITLTFDKALTTLECWQGTVSTSDNKVFTITWDMDYEDGRQISLHFLARFSSKANLIAADVDGQNVCVGGVTTSRPTTAKPTTSIPETTTPPQDNCKNIVDEGSDDGTTADVSISITPTMDVESWTVELNFLSSVFALSTPMAEVTGGGTTWTLTNKGFDGSLPAGETFILSFNVDHGGNGLPGFDSIYFNDLALCEPITTEAQTTTESTDSGYTPDHPAKYNYAEVLEKTLLFYEAQRSGPLPASNRVPWRDNSGMSDEVLGGYHDAGDHVKFGFPMAAFTTVLAWSGINFRSGYDKAGQLDYLYECLKWSTDYFIGCHTSDYEFIGQIGDGYADHAFWGRPEDMTMARPSFRITASAPGSELAGETAAALASSSIFFRNMGYADYADECLQHARKLFEFADKYRGDYTDAIPVSDFYNDFGGYNDELAWAAAWVAMASRDSADIAKAEDMYNEVSMGTASPGEVSWDDKSAMVFLVMYELTGKAEYKAKAEEFANYINSCERTGKGLIWIPSSQWGSLRYAANFAMYATQLVKNDIMADDMFKFAESQVNYVLGDTGRSYLVGFGSNPPLKAHHRAASCPDRPAPCDWANKDSPNPNPQIIYGALVGGPDRGDNYVDDRNRFEMTEVADDYNAGFQAAAAGLNTFFK